MRVLALALVVLELGAVLPSCATLRSAGPAVRAAAIDCVHADQAPIEQLLVDLHRAALDYARYGEPIDWDALADRAAAQGEVVGGCAFVRLVSPGSSSARSTAQDSSLAALERLRARFDGVRWSTAAGER